MKQMARSMLLIANLIFFNQVNAQENYALINSANTVLMQSEILDDVVNIRWVTQREVNIRCFILERSLDGINFTVMAMVAPKNNYAVTSQYKMEDEEINLQPGMQVHYRLKTVDMNGMQSITSLVVEKDAAGLISSR